MCFPADRRWERREGLEGFPAMAHEPHFQPSRSPVGQRVQRHVRKAVEQGGLGAAVTEMRISCVTDFMLHDILLFCCSFLVPYF